VTIDQKSDASLAPQKYSEQFFEMLLESAPDAMVIVDQNGSIVIANGQAEAMFQFSREEMCGNKIELLLANRFRDHHIDLRNRYISAPKLRAMGLGLELPGRRKDGSEFPVEVSLSPVSTDAGTFVASVIRDVTDRNEMEAALIEARKDAERANSANSAFLAAASHDLRQPVQALSLLNGALRRTVTEPKSLQMLESQDQSLTAMTNLLNSLLDISRLDAGGVTAKFENFPISQLIDQLSSEFSRQARQTDLTFESTSCGAIVRSDPGLLTEIVQNFVSNSIRYTAAGSIRLSCSISDSRCRVEVRDTGVGIEADQLEEIFSPFYQCQKPGTSKEGFGLGLAIVARIAKLLGHEVSVESTPGEGSCFCISLPLVEKVDDVEDPRSQNHATEPSRTAHGIILLIEDDERVAAALTILLETEGYSIISATTKSEATQAIKQLDGSPDLIISDYHLADTSNGAETISTLRRQCSTNIPALIITGDTSRVVDDARSILNCELLNKPINSDYLLSLVSDRLRAKQP
jgi:PAS domain S-box-containing protein